MAYKARLKEFDDCLQGDVIDLKTLKKLCFNGIPDTAGFRPLCWKLLLGYLPPERESWKDTLEKNRRLYKNFIDDLVVLPGTEDANGDNNFLDHPLSCNPDSRWQTFFKDNEVLLQIDKDVRRLCPDISFFQQPTEYPCHDIVSSKEIKRLHTRVQRSVLKCANVERKGLGITKITLLLKKAPEDYEPMAEGQEAHWEVVERILFLYAKLNPGQGYVQGMNEIVGPIYYAFACDPDLTFREHAEADCFFCFTNLMSEIRDFFIKTLDSTDCGINNMMTRLSMQLRKSDLDIWLRFQQLELRPEYYSFRWLTLLLSQEFPLPDVLRIWDTLFSDENRFDFLIYICCAMIVVLRDKLIRGDFPSNLKLLQSFPPTEIQKILPKSFELFLQNS
ncbi:TBC1 domain family member 13 [Onthophagus taurus]|uniref:TBC1 domain family member 13 n=1 Tax=Onthophagus taurus TaxID=166361 RepID=UPI000C20C433|nr:TBC1 domain family member 13 isoform X3 [Onthophagus taurus]XP_022908310.1 TBC1 domain family member 13 isoform X4 [Onthophagus taurus]